MNNIEWKDGAVCYAGDTQWVAPLNDGMIEDSLIYIDFQLNEIKTGDYIEDSELDTEQKYNDVVEVFGLFGFERVGEYSLSYSEFMSHPREDALIASEDLLMGINGDNSELERKLTYPQIMAIGRLKRLMSKPKSNRVSIVNRDLEWQMKDKKLSATANKYERDIADRQGNSAVVDVYDVLKAFNVTCPATQHAVKKLLCSGLRGHKDLQTDLLEAKESIIRAIELSN